MINLCVDCGHGGSDSGAIGVNNSLEKDYNLSIGLKVAEILKNYEVNVILTRETDKFISLEERVNLSNKNKCDLFISIHCNAHTNESANGFETYTINKNDKLQNIFHSNFNSLNTLKDRGKKQNNFYVLKYTKCEAILIEVGFITNANDEKFIKNNIQALSNAIVKSIIEYKGLKLIDNRKIYRVVVGSYTNKDNANNMVRQLEKEGYKPFIVKATI